MIFFDLDGTLYRTHETGLSPLIALCAECGLGLTDEEIRRLLFTTTDTLLSRIAPDMPQEQRELFKERYRSDELEEVKKKGRLFDGIESLLSHLQAQGIPLAICGMGYQEYIHCVLEKCRIAQYFDVVLHRVEGKTKTQVLSECIAREGLNPQECLMIGDSITDYTAAKESGVPFIGVSYGYGAQDIPKDAVMVDHVSQIMEEIERVWAGMNGKLHHITRVNRA